MIVVADAGPIISFARAGHDTLLRQVLTQLVIPEAVYTEMMAKGVEAPGAALVQEGIWIRLATVRDRVQVDRLPVNLGSGEREALVLAQERGATLLVDDLAVRKEAAKRSIPYFGSLRVLQRAKQKGLIDSAGPVVTDLRRAGLRLGDRLHQTFLREMGE
ncbi:MAG: DUF3368 domain-containing protein [Candidatus Latescibacteria bacterium]|nr:DUF3368 domain-containing protein [Candidatus Latescibacterota bacterium]